MCGIAGLLDLSLQQPASPQALAAMCDQLVHRGPDESGYYAKGGVGLGSRRLSIVDLAQGRQPIANEDGSVVVVFNGEIFNHRQLRSELMARGHHFATKTDTEVLVHLYEEAGSELCSRLRGQFAIALWDERRQRLVLARDRFGERPLYWTVQDRLLLFASEIKALLTHPAVPRELNHEAVAQIFSGGFPMAPATLFRGIHCLPPAHVLVAERGEVQLRPYWDPGFAEPNPAQRESDYVEELADALREAIQLQIESADVPVGAYLSGGIDSSTVCSLMGETTNRPVQAFSLGFTNSFHNELSHAERVARHLGCDWEQRIIDGSEIAAAFPRLIWHAETGVLYTEAVAMMLLAERASRKVKVVLTGEGADEILGGYPYYMLAEVYRRMRGLPGLLAQPLKGALARVAGFPPGLFPEPSEEAAAAEAYGCFPGSLFIYGYQRRVSSPLLEATVTSAEPWPPVLPEFRSRAAGWAPLNRSMYYSQKTMMSNYILSTHGDRALMAHSLEARYPFLDQRVVEVAARMPTSLKVKGLQEKYVLRRMMADKLPQVTTRRRKKMMTAPLAKSFLAREAPDYVKALLTPERLKETGCFVVPEVTGMLERLKARTSGFDRDSHTEYLAETAFVGVLSVQLVHEMLIKGRGPI